MDDFRVGSIPPAEPFGDRHPYGPVARKRPKHHNEGQEGEEEPADTFEAASEEEKAPASTDNLEDYYLPSEPADGE